MCKVNSKACVKWPLSKRPKNGFEGRSSLNVGQKYCRMLQREHSAILLTFIKLPVVIKVFVLSIFELPFYTCFTGLLLNFTPVHGWASAELPRNHVNVNLFLRHIRDLSL